MTLGHRLLASLGMALLLATPKAALGDPQLVPTACDTVSFDPVQVEIDFAIINPDPVTICRVRLTPWDSVDPPATPCPINACGSPPEPWFCFGPPWTTIWEGISEGPDDLAACIHEGETLGGFSITIQSSTCCYNVAYFAPGLLEPFYAELVCVSCGDAVQVNAYSWGRVKSIYR